MNLQSITGIYPSNIGSYTQSITGVYNTNTGGGGEYINTDNNIVIDNVSNIINLSTNIITSITDLSNNKQDNISLIAGNNISISNLNSSWTIEAIASGAEYSNPDNNLVINNISDTINLSTNINVSNLNTSSLIIPDNTITKNKITNLNTSLDSLSNNIGSLNTSVSNLSGAITTLNTSVSGLSGDITTLNTSVSGLSSDISTLNTSVSGLSGNITTLNTSVSDLSNNKQDNITLVAGNNISISNLNSSWTIEAIATGGQYSNPDNNLVINNVSDTINLSTTINISNLNTSSLTIPDNTITKNKITNLNLSLNSLSNSIGSLNTSITDLSNDKQDNITLVGGTGISISNLNSSWTISSTLTGTNNISVLNNSINLSTSINVSNVNTSTLTIPNNTLTKSKITDLVANLSSINSSITNLNNDKEDNISIVAGNNISILFDNNNNKWTINTSSNLSVASSSDNLSILNGSINLSESIYTYNGTFDNLYVNTSIDMPIESIPINKIKNLTANISSINSSITNLSNDKQNNITLIAGANISISKLNSSWTIEALESQYSNTDNNLVINNVSDTINLSTTINTSDINTSNLSAITTYFNETNTSFLYVSIDANISNINSSNQNSSVINSSVINSSDINSSNIYTNILASPEINVSSLGASVIDTTSINITNNLNTSTLFSNTGTITNFGSTEIIASTTNSRNINSSIINTININSSNFNFSNISVNNISANNITTGICNVSNIYSSIITTDDINVDDITVIENGRFLINAGGIIPQSGIINANLAKVNISCSSGLYLALSQGIKERIQIYNNIINLNLSTNISGELNVSKLTSSSLTTNTINTSNISSNNMSILNDLTVSSDLTASNMSATNISVSNDLSVTGVLTAPNFSLGNLSSLTIGQSIIGESSSLPTTTATFFHKNYPSTPALYQDINGDTAINGVSNINMDGKVNISSTAFYSLYISRELNSDTAGCMIRMRKAYTSTPPTAWRLGPSGSSAVNNNFVIEPANVTQGSIFNLKPNGNLGIGTTSPYARLHIDSGGSATEMFFGGPIGADKIAIIKYIQGNGSGNGQLQLGHFGQPNPLGFYLNYNGDTVTTRNDYSNYTATGYNPQYGTNFGMWSHRNWNNDSQRYMALQEQGGDTYLNGYNRLSLRIRNQDRLYVDNNGAQLPNGTAISSDDRLKFEEQDISGLSIIRQLNPKKYIKIDLPYVKKRRRYYDEYEVSIIDDYIYDICQNEVDKINQERRDISLNDLSYNDYYRDEDYIHKDKITEEDVNAYITEEDISNGQVECGLIAQEVLETDISWVVHQQNIPDDIQKPLFQPLSVRYNDIYPYCIQAIKELDVLLQKQTNQYNELDVIVQGLRDKVNNLEAENDILLGRVQELENV